MNIYAPDKISLLSESPEGNPIQQYEYRRREANDYWTAIYMAYRLDRKGESTIKAWDWFFYEVYSTTKG